MRKAPPRASSVLFFFLPGVIFQIKNQIAFFRFIGGKKFMQQRNFSRSAGVLFKIDVFGQFFRRTQQLRAAADIGLQSVRAVPVLPLPTVFDGVAWLRDQPDSRDMCILEAPEEEGIYIASIDLDLLREYRKNEVMGAAWRHPGKYTELISAGKITGKQKL